MNDAILGYTGFVGSHIFENLPFANCYNSKNIQDIRGKHFNIIYCACIPAIKWLANKEPENDQRQIDIIKSHLEHVTCEQFVLISTIDIHDSSVMNQTENTSTWKITKESYGKHRFEFEQWVTTIFKRVHIIRIPALFGLGIKKNVIYDLLHLNNLENIHLNDEYQWYDLRYLFEDIQFVLKNNISYFHPYPEPISNFKIISELFPHLMPHIGTKVMNVRNKIVYNQKSVFAKRENMFERLKMFVRISLMSKERIVVSSLQWEPEHDLIAATILKKHGVKNIELVPWKYIDMKSYTNEDVETVKTHWDKLGLSIPSLQAILYGIDGNFESSAEQINRRLRQVNDIANIFGAKRLVLGSPTLRSTGNISDIANVIRDYQSESDPECVLCIEHVSKEYGCAIGCRFDEVVQLKEHVLNKNVGINFDLGNASMENDTYNSIYKDHVKHIQVSMPFLKDMNIEQLNKYNENAIAIRECSNTFITMEVKSTINKLSDNLYTFLGWLSEHIEPKYTKDALIIGCGWYGCHLANLLLEKGITFDMQDKTDAICTGSSFKNQNRLHLGFHYPRSAKTRRECVSGFDKFKERYPTVLNKIENYYLIANESIIDAITYQSIFSHEKVKYEESSWEDLKPFEFNMQCFDVNSYPLRVDEEMIDPERVQYMFQNQCEIYRKSFNNSKCIQTSYKYVFDCTYGNLISLNNFYREQCITFIIRMKCKRSSIAITIMDGPFFSIYPYHIEKQLYTLTHVVYTPKIGQMSAIEIYDELCKDVIKYIPNYNDIFEYDSYYISEKTKLVDAKNDDRSMVYNKTGNIHSFIGGKITGVFELEEHITKMLKM